ncbi:hypothetical protein PR202_gb02811 [Eleusine coracana subsp. coracana]|uniref:F-box domain-containing protein n=1 Tax=Eleusine coracana subsp. coracana TaxID=191504 RepID=A0AAV5E014_ELECO|nr:hypothetical protein PR202_gb02811 [Eleusine coracana subsp. coracana]
MANAGFFLPTDVLVLILLRLPTSARRRFRLVSKLWRDAIDERTKEMQSRSKIVAFFSQPGGARACVIHDDYRQPDDEWEFFTDSGIDHGLDIENGIVHMVGSCNGLICLRDCCWSSWLDCSYLNLTKIVIVNPMTGKTIQLPSEPKPWVKSGDTGQYSFAYHPTTGKYKVVHASSRFTTTRGKKTPGVAGGAHPGGLELQRLGQPRLHRRHDGGGRVGARTQQRRRRDRRQPCWSWRYSLLESSSSTDDHGRWITTPQFTHGDYVLSIQDRVWPYTHWRQLHRRKAGDLTANNGKNAEVWPLEGAEFLMKEEILRGTVATFAYVETLEPLPSGLSSNCRTSLCIPTDDAFVEILLRLPTSSRRRFRLVCKRWRDLINERTPERRVLPKILAFLNQNHSSRTLVFDDKDGHRRNTWTFPSSRRYGRVHLVGTCNGFLCLNESWMLAEEGGRYSAITVINPITGEKRGSPAGANYLFSGPILDSRQVQLRLPPNHSIDDGSTYWLSAFADRVMALDLDDEGVTSFCVAPQARRRAASILCRRRVAIDEHPWETGLRGDGFHNPGLASSHHLLRHASMPMVRSGAASSVGVLLAVMVGAVVRRPWLRARDAVDLERALAVETAWSSSGIPASAVATRCGTMPR